MNASCVLHGVCLVLCALKRFVPFPRAFAVVVHGRFSRRDRRRRFAISRRDADAPEETISFVTL